MSEWQLNTLRRLQTGKACAASTKKRDVSGQEQLRQLHF